MSVSSALARGRAAALQLMVDACTITRLGDRVWNNVSGDYTQPPTTVYSGVCRIKSSGGGSDTQFGEHEATLHKYQVILPWDTSAEVQRGDRITITVSDDAWVIGRVMEVTDVAYSGTSTARRITVEDRS
jgi:hypothetical protein